MVKKLKLSTLFTIISIFLIFSSIIYESTYGLAQGTGPQHKAGPQSPEDGTKQYPFDNNIQVNISTTTNANVDLKIEEGLANRFIGININASEPVNISFIARKNFGVKPGKKMQWYKKSDINPNPSYIIGSQGLEEDSIEEFNVDYN